MRTMQKRKSREAGEVTVIGTGRGPRNSGPPSLTSPDRRSRDSWTARLFFQDCPHRLPLLKVGTFLFTSSRPTYLHKKTIPSFRFWRRAHRFGLSILGSWTSLLEIWTTQVPLSPRPRPCRHHVARYWIVQYQAPPRGMLIIALLAVAKRETIADNNA